MFKISEGKLYLSPIMDMYDGSIISYDISITADFNQAKRMINSAFNQFDDLKAAMEEYIRYYNEERISLKRKGLTPLQFRYQSLAITI